MSTVDNDDHLGANPGGDLEQLGCWLTPACQAWQAAKSLHHFVVHPMVDTLSVKQENGLDVPSHGHWRAEFCAHNHHAGIERRPHVPTLPLDCGATIA